MLFVELVLPKKQFECQRPSTCMDVLVTKFTSRSWSLHLANSLMELFSLLFLNRPSISPLFNFSSSKGEHNFKSGELKVQSWLVRLISETSSVSLAAGGRADVVLAFGCKGRRFGSSHHWSNFPLARHLFAVVTFSANEVYCYIINEWSKTEKDKISYTHLPKCKQPPV